MNNIKIEVLYEDNTTTFEAHRVFLFTASPVFHSLFTGPWKDKELILKIAKQFQTRSGFERGSPEAYAASRRHGWHEEACAHMKAVDNGYYHCAYSIINQRLNQAYIGITSQQFEDRMNAHKAPKNRSNSSKIAFLDDTEFIQLICHHNFQPKLSHYPSAKVVTLVPHVRFLRN